MIFISFSCLTVLAKIRIEVLRTGILTFFPVLVGKHYSFTIRYDVSYRFCRHPLSKG